MNFRIPASAEHVRSIKDPNNSKTRIVHALVNINDLPHDIPLDPDPRRPKDKGAVPKKIISSLRTNDGRFHLLNRGITVSVKHYDFDNKRNALTLVIPAEDDQYGIIDGGHSYNAITKAVDEERQRLLKESEAESDDGVIKDLNPRVFDDQFVHLEVLERIEDHLADIAEARNFSVALKAWTLANYRDKFDWLLDALGREYAERVIRVSENDAQPVGILDVIQVLGAINPLLFSEEKPAQEAYKNAGKLLEYFIEGEDKHGFRKLAPVSRDILRLYDHIRHNFKKKYNERDEETGKRGLFAATKEAREAKQKRSATSKATYYWLDPLSGPIVGSDVVDKGLAIPLISGFRVLLAERDGNFCWLTDPIKFFDEYGSKLARTIMNASDNANHDPHTVGRDPQVYRQLTSEVRRWYLEDQFAKQAKAKS